MTDTDAKLAAYINRILRLREEEDGIKEDVRDVYAEAKADGFDKTVMGKIVAHIRAKAKDAEKLATQDELFALYLTAYERASHTHTREAA